MCACRSLYTCAGCSNSIQEVCTACECVFTVLQETSYMFVTGPKVVEVRTCTYLYVQCHVCAYVCICTCMYVYTRMYGLHGLSNTCACTYNMYV